MQKVSVYIRVSTQDQAKEGYSIPAQKEKLMAFCIAKNWSIQDIYIDDGYTGTNLQRPGLQQMLENLDTANIVLVYKLDRLSRSQKDVLYLVEEKFLKQGVDFVSVLESFDTSTPFGRAMLGILAVFAQLERETIIERASLGKKEQAKQGKWRGGPVPLGYDYIDGKLVINGYEAEIIRKIYQYYLDGLGMDAISRKLNQLGYRSKENKPFTSPKIHRYLNNVLYTGMIPYKNQVFPGEHEGIIDPSTFERVQALIKEKTKSFHKNTPSLLGGLVMCGECGAKVFRRKMNKYSYYTCYTYHGSPTHMITAPACSLGYKNAEQLEKEVMEQLQYSATDILALKDIASILLSKKAEPIHPSLSNRLVPELDEMKREISRWYNAYGKGSMDLEVVSKRLEELRVKKQRMEKDLTKIQEHNQNLEDAQIDLDQLLKIMNNFPLILQFCSVEEKKKILRGFVEAIYIYKEKPPMLQLRP